MTPDICLLITLTDGERLFKVVLKIDMNELPYECTEYWAEPENKAALFQALLPDIVKHAGKIVDVEQISEIIDRTI